MEIIVEKAILLGSGCEHVRAVVVTEEPFKQMKKMVVAAAECESVELHRVEENATEQEEYEETGSVLYNEGDVEVGDRAASASLGNKVYTWDRVYVEGA